MPRDTGFTLAEPKARLLVRSADLTETARELRDLLAKGDLFDRGGPARLVHDPEQGGVVARRLTIQHVVHEAHRAAQPYVVRTRQDQTQEQDVTCPSGWRCFTSRLTASGSFVRCAASVTCRF